MKRHPALIPAARRKRGERGAAALESVIALLVLFLILFAMLQIHQWCQMRQFCQYAAFYSSKGTALGYVPNLALRAARVAAIPVCGRQDGAFSGTVREAANAYMVNGDASGVHYEYWHSQEDESEPHLDFYYRISDANVDTHIRMENSQLFEESALKKLLLIERTPQPGAIVTSRNYAKIYLED